MIKKRQSRFLARTISNIKELKTSAEKTSQLNESLHSSLASERQDLSRFADIAESIRVETKNAELIRLRVKRIRDKLIQTAENMKQISKCSSEVKEELNRVRVDIQFTNVSPAPTPKSENGSDVFSLIGDEFKRWSKISGSSPVCAKRIVTDLTLEQVRHKLNCLHNGYQPQIIGSEVDSCGRWTPDSKSTSDIKCETDDLQLLVFLLKAAEAIHDQLEENAANLSEDFSNQVCNEFTEFVKGTVRNSRYESHEFTTAYGHYQDAVRNLNNAAKSRPGSTLDDDSDSDCETQGSFSNNGNSPNKSNALKALFGANKPVDPKRIQLLREQVDDAKIELDRKSECSFAKLVETEIEWESGVFPLNLLRHIQELRIFFQAGLDACNSILPPEDAELLKHSLQQRQFHRKQEVEANLRSNTQFESFAKHAEVITSNVILPPLIPKKPSHLSSIGQRPLSEVPKFAPPPPPVLTNIVASDVLIRSPTLPPTPPSVAPKIPISQLIFPSALHDSTKKLLLSITDPSCSFLRENLLGDSILHRKSLLLMRDGLSFSPIPSPFDIQQNSVSSSYDFIQRCIQLVSECGKLPEWLNSIWKYSDFSSLKNNLSLLKNGDYVWTVKEADECSSSYVSSKMQNHILAYISKHYVQKCVKEIHNLVVSISGDDLDWTDLLRRSFKIILGHRGLVSRTTRRMFAELVENFDECDKKRIIAILIFYQLIIPALLSASKLTAHWEKSFAPSSTTQNTFEDPHRVDEILVSLTESLQMTLAHVLDVPQPHIHDSINHIRFDMISSQISKENKTSFQDFFAIISRKPADNVNEQTPDIWMLEMWAQELNAIYIE